jgi:hypothetical protein
MEIARRYGSQFSHRPEWSLCCPSINETSRLQARPSRIDIVCFLMNPETPNFFGLECGTLWWSCITRVIDINTRRNWPNSCPISRNNDRISQLNVIYRSCFLETITYLSHFLRGPDFQILRSSTTLRSEPPELRPWKSQQQMDSVIEAGSWMTGRFSRWQHLIISLFD